MLCLKDVIRAYKMDRTMKPSWLTADEGFSIPMEKVSHIDTQNFYIFI